LRLPALHASNYHEEWMMSLEDSGPAAIESPALSWRQRRELLELVAAGVMSAVFFTAPVVLVRHTPPAKSAPAPAPASAVAAKSTPVPMAPLQAVQVVTMDVAVPVSSPELAATPAVVHAVRWNAPPPSRRPVTPRPPRQTLGRRIARLFAGDGTHTVQPFPGVPATQR
jgi:hypothetical protein